MNKKLLAEFFGTFTLSLVVILSVSGSFPVATPVLASLALLLFVYTIGVLSGCHINPAVTLGLLSLKKISKSDSISYIASQFAGAIVAIAIVVLLGVNLPNPNSNGFIVPFIAETLGTALFTFGIMAVVLGTVPKTLSGIVIGGSLLLGVALASLSGSIGILNPAVALSLRSFTLAYIAGPIVGSILGMKLYTNLYSSPTHHSKPLKSK